METPAVAPRELPIVGGHLALDFANTVDDPEGPARHDHLDTYAALLRWTTRVAALPATTVAELKRHSGLEPDGAERALRQALELRTALNDIFGPLSHGSTTESDTLVGWPVIRDRAAGALLAATPHSTHTTKPQLHLTWGAPADLLTPLHPVAIAATELLLSADLRRLKRCARCPWLFLDTSKNHSRRWCDMNDCGRAQKIERYVARRAKRRQEH